MRAKVAKKKFEDMSEEELLAERAYWQNRINKAKGWGAALGAAQEFLDECNKFLERKANAQ